MGKFVKYSSIFLVVVFAALFAAPFFMDVDDYRHDIVKIIEDKTGRDVDIKGMKISLFPWVGVQLDDVRMGNAQGFEQKDFVFAKYIDVQLALLPLLSGEVSIKRFVLDSPKILLQRKTNGESNWQDLEQRFASIDAKKDAEPEVKQDDSPNALLAGLSANNIHLQNGDFTWIDGDQTLHISQLDLEVNGIYLDKPIPLHLSGQLDDSAFQLQAKVGPIGSLESIDPLKIPLQAELSLDGMRLQQLAVLVPSMAAFKNERLSLDVKFEQHPDGLKRSLGSISLQTKQQWKMSWILDMPSLDLLKVHEFSIHVDQKEIAMLTADVKDLLKNPSYEARLKVEGLKRDYLSRWLPVLEDMYQGHPKPWSEVELAMFVSGDRKHVELRDMQLLLDKELVQFSGQALLNQKIPSLKLRVSADQLHLDPWLPAEKKKEAKKVNADEKKEPAKEPDLRFLSQFNVNADVQIKQINVKSLDFKHIQVKATLKKGVLNVNPFNFDFSGGHIQQKFQLNANRFPATWSEKLQLKRVQIKPLLVLAADSSMLSGLMQMETSVHATGLTPEKMMPSLNGQGHFVLRDGEVEGFDIGAVLSTLSPSKGENKTHFSQLSGSYKIHKGVMSNNDLFMASPLFRLSAHGVVNLVKKTMDYYAKPKLVASTTGQGAVQGANTGMVIPLRIHGSLSDPKIDLNVNLKDILSAPSTLKKLKIPAVQKLIDPKVGKQADDIRKSINQLIPNF
ncbi:MAG: AsmA family protein [Mariprofundaceae bacterium]|nr:AsmA family protein [Mariprofundaceae bacterium]